MVPAGGLEGQGRWKSSKSKGKYLFNRGVMGSVFRARYVKRLRQEIAKGNLPKVSDKLFKKLFAKEWITFAKEPFSGPQQILNYIGRYSHKIAITNHRIEKVDEKGVHFWVKNYRKEGQKEPLVLKSKEFVRRFAMHIVPHKFIRIRHYGILSNRNKKQSLAAARAVLGKAKIIKKEASEIAIESLPVNHYPHYCKYCGAVTVHLLLEVIPPEKPDLNCRGSPQGKPENLSK